MNLALTGRLDRLRANLQERGFSNLLVTEPKNIRYLCGFSGSSGWLLVGPDYHLVITDGRYWDQVARECPGAELFKFVALEHASLPGGLVEVLKQKALDKLGLETNGITLTNYRALTQALEKSEVAVQEVEGLVHALRECKDPEEIALMRRAAEIADQALGRALQEFQPGQKEIELKALIEFHIFGLGGSAAAFPTIVASGPNGSYPHAGASDRVVERNELITIDFGAVYRGYCSDMTRTIWYGRLSDRHRDVLGATRQAQRLALEEVRAGVATSSLDKIARDCLERAGLAQYFLHSLGHGVGLDVHEAPSLRLTSDDILKVGQVVTIEPGVYIQGETGCRVEDTVVVTEGRPDVLNRYPKQALDADTPPGLEP